MVMYTQCVNKYKYKIYLKIYLLKYSEQIFKVERSETLKNIHDKYALLDLSFAF